MVIPPVPAEDAAAWAALDELIERQGPRPTVFHNVTVVRKLSPVRS